MRHAFHILLIVIFTTGFMACGGDEPIPTSPAEEGQGADSTATEIADTTITDSTKTEKDSLKVVVDIERTKNYCHHVNYTNNGEKTGMVITDKLSHGDTVWTIFNMGGVEGEKYRFELIREGYVGQNVAMTLYTSRNLDFDLQPESTTGLAQGKADTGKEGILLTNDSTNLARTGLAASVHLPQGSRIGKGKAGDRLSAVTFLPTATDCDLTSMDAGDIVEGAVAGVAITPFGLDLPDGAEVAVTLPIPMDGYYISAISGNTRESVGGTGREIDFTTHRGTEWILTMEARIVAVTKERRLIVEGLETRRWQPSMVKINGEWYYAADLRFTHAIGYESDSQLNFVEERFLTSCFGRKGEHEVLTEIGSNHTCTIKVNIFQDTYHFTFEAGGRQFQATVYGNCQVEVASAYDNEGRTYP